MQEKDMATFKLAYDRTMSAEGGYSNNPNDLGGETFKGIARKKNPSWGGWQIVDALRKSGGFPGNLKGDAGLGVQVQKFYKSEYWDRVHGDDIAEQPIANELFDTGVNCGQGIAVQILQRALNLLNNRASLWPNIAVDGGFGYGTLDALRACLAKGRGKRLFNAMNILQGMRYIEIMERNESQEEFAGGWLARVEVVQW